MPTTTVSGTTTTMHVVSKQKSVTSMYAESAVIRSQLMLDQLGLYVDMVSAQNARLAEIADMQKKVRSLLDQFTTTDSTATGKQSKEVDNPTSYQGDLKNVKEWADEHNFSYEMNTKGQLESALAGLKSEAENVSTKVGADMALAGDFRGKSDLAVQELANLLKTQRELLQQILAATN